MPPLGFDQEYFSQPLGPKAVTISKAVSEAPLRGSIFVIVLAPGLTRQEDPLVNQAWTPI